MNQRESQVIIAGGGIAGLCTAVGLSRNGFGVQVVEAMPKMLPVGAGLHVWVNGMRALERLGLARDVLAAGSEVDLEEFMTSKGSTLFNVSVADLRRQYGGTVTFIARPELQRVLLEALGDGVVQPGSECTGFAQDADGVTVRLKDGRELRGDLLIGADGASSAVRRQFLGEVPLKYAGYLYFRAITDFQHPSVPAGTQRILYGTGARFGIAHVGPEQLYWWGIVNAPEGSTDAAVGRKGEVLQRFAGWQPPVETLIESTPESRIARTDVYDIDPIERWGEGRVTLVGDAAHAMTPGMGRGASEAIEDAAALTESLAAVGAGGGDPRPGLRAYESGRSGPAAKIAKRSRSAGASGQWSNPIACTFRNALMRTVLGRVISNEMTSDFKAPATRP